MTYALLGYDVTDFAYNPNTPLSAFTFGDLQFANLLFISSSMILMFNFLSGMSMEILSPFLTIANGSPEAASGDI